MGVDRRQNPAYSPTLYIDGLIGENTVTTVPDATLDAFRDAPDRAPERFTVLDDVDRARADLAALAEAGVDLDEMTPPTSNAPACSSSPIAYGRQTWSRDTPAESTGAPTRRRSCGREGSRRSRTATRAEAPGRARTLLGRVAADTSSDGACGV